MVWKWVFQNPGALPCQTPEAAFRTTEHTPGDGTAKREPSRELLGELEKWKTDQEKSIFVVHASQFFDAFCTPDQKSNDSCRQNGHTVTLSR
jgi:hypothetical protein